MTLLCSVAIPSVSLFLGPYRHQLISNPIVAPSGSGRIKGESRTWSHITAGSVPLHYARLSPMHSVPATWEIVLSFLGLGALTSTFPTNEASPLSLFTSPSPLRHSSVILVESRFNALSVLKISALTSTFFIDKVSPLPSSRVLTAVAIHSPLNTLSNHPFKPILEHGRYAYASARASGARP
jgi:hypothetical protein